MLIMSSGISYLHIPFHEKLTQVKLFKFLVPYDMSFNTNSNKYLEKEF